MNKIILFAIVAFLIFGTGAGVIMSRPSINVRNKNPLNIRYAVGNNWDGQLGENGGFCVFESEFYGFRAAAILIRNYRRLYNVKTVKGIVSRWAPPNENNTISYVKFVCKELGVSEGYAIESETDVKKMLLAMSIMEGAPRGIYKDSIVDDAVRAANTGEWKK